MSKFGWSLPPGCSMRDIDEQAGIEGPLDCPVCADGIEMDGDDCLKCGCTTCKKHGCVVCQDLEKQRKYCAGPFCGGYIMAQTTPIEKDGRVFCCEQCVNDAEIGEIE